jgi:hypothetical protein
MERVNGNWLTRNTKRLVLGVGLLSLTTVLVARSHLISHYQNHPTNAVAASPPLLSNGNWNVALSHPLFRLPIDAQESLFVRMYCKLDEQEGSPKSYGVVQYGIGTEAAQIEEWLRKPQFGDAEHARWIMRQVGSYKGEPVPLEELVPVRWTNHAVQMALPPEACPRSAYVMRLRQQVEPSGSARTQQVEVAHLEWLPETGWQTEMEALYVQGAKDNPSLLQLQSKELRRVSAEANWWIVAWFNSEAPRNESLVIVGVLAGQFVNRDGTITLKAGEAACVRLQHTSTSRKVEYIQPAELRVQNGQCMLRWDAAVASGYRLLEVKLYAVPSPLPVLANSIEEWNKLLRGAITLDASWYWAPQKPAYNPNF